MDNQKLETLSMEIIAYAGDARCKAKEALALAKQGNLARADRMMEEADEIFLKAHKAHYRLLQSSANGEIGQNTLSVHAQCHLTIAECNIDYVKEFIELYRKGWAK